MTAFLAFVMGLGLGTIVGIVLAALMAAAGQAEREHERRTDPTAGIPTLGVDDHEGEL